AGQRMLVQWERGKSPQERALIAPATAEEFQTVMGRTVPATVGVECQWWAATPDGDTYPHMLHAKGVYSAMELDRRGRGRPASTIGRQLDTEAEPYNAEWNPSPAFSLECLESVTGMSFDVMLRTALAHSDAQEEPEAEGPGPPAQAPASKKPDQTEKSCHHRLSKSAGEYLGMITDLSVMLSFAISGIGLALYHGYAVIYFTTQAPKDASLDARVLGICDTSEEGRRLSWRDAVSEFSETEWPKFPISGLVMASPSEVEDGGHHPDGRRKMREGRSEHQASASSHECKGGQAALQSSVDKQRSDITKLKAQIATPGKAGSKCDEPGSTPSRLRDAAADDGLRRMLFINSWMSARLAAVTWLGGREGSPDFNSLSLSQRVGVLDLRSRLASLGPSRASSAAALSELRRAAPGYLEEPAQPAAFAVDSVALPLDDVKCKPSEHLVGQASDMWRLFKAGMITFEEDTACAVAPFFVAKAGGRRRLVLDTREVSSYFHDPAMVELPTAGAWGGLRTREGDELVVEQVDIEAAFYRVEAPVGLSELMALPVISGKRTAPRLVMLPMGWNWSLYFCQHVVLAHVLKAGFREKDMISDRHAVKNIALSPSVATDVGGAAAVGVNRRQAQGGIAAVERELEAGGLRCKGIATAADEQPLAGLVFQQATGEARLPPGRPWKIRFALLEPASRKYVSGRAVFQLVGHCNWAALLRRPLLSFFSATYRRSRKAGDNARRPWPDVAPELRAAGALPGLAHLDARRSECWRHLGAGAAAAREHAYSSQLAAGLEQVNRDQDECGAGKVVACAGESAPGGLTTDRETQSDFVGLDTILVFPLDAWTSALFGRWARSENFL
ncbi:unnamed protein product, partial [Prorocentrum cordatum]